MERSYVPASQILLCTIPHGTAPSITGLLVGPYLPWVLLSQSLWPCHCSLRCPPLGRAWYSSRMLAVPSCVPSFRSSPLPPSGFSKHLSCPEFVFLVFSCILTIRQVPQDEQLCLPSSVPGHQGCRAAQCQASAPWESLVHSGAAPCKSRSLSSRVSHQCPSLCHILYF